MSEPVTNYPLVMIRWVDSTQPHPAWVFLESLDKAEVVQCVSVGWLVEDTDELKSLAPNVGLTLGESEAEQASGIFVIPTQSVIEITPLYPSSPPSTYRKRSPQS